MTPQFPHYRVIQKQKEAGSNQWDFLLNLPYCLLIASVLIGFLLGRYSACHK